MIRSAIVSRFLAACLLAAMLDDARGAATSIEWKTNVRDCTKQSESSCKSILIYFFSDTNQNCKACDKNIFSDSSIAQIIGSNFIPLKINVTDAPATARFYHASSATDIPLVLIIGSDAKEKVRIPLSQEKPTEFIAQLIPFLSSGTSAVVGKSEAEITDKADPSVKDAAQADKDKSNISKTIVADSAKSDVTTQVAPTKHKTMGVDSKNGVVDSAKSTVGQTSQLAQAARNQIAQSTDGAEESVVQHLDAAKQSLAHQADGTKQSVTQQIASTRQSLNDQSPLITNSFTTQTNNIVAKGSESLGQDIGQASSSMSAAGNTLAAGGNSPLNKMQLGVPQQQIPSIVSPQGQIQVPLASANSATSFTSGYVPPLPQFAANTVPATTSSQVLPATQAPAPSQVVSTVLTQPAASQSPPPYVAPVSSPINGIVGNPSNGLFSPSPPVDPPSYSQVGSIYDPSFSPRISSANANPANTQYNAPLPSAANATVTMMPAPPSASEQAPKINQSSLIAQSTSTLSTNQTLSSNQSTTPAVMAKPYSAAPIAGLTLPGTISAIPPLSASPTSNLSLAVPLPSPSTQLSAAPSLSMPSSITTSSVGLSPTSSTISTPPASVSATTGTGYPTPSSTYAAVHSIPTLDNPMRIVPAQSAVGAQTIANNADKGQISAYNTENLQKYLGAQPNSSTLNNPIPAVGATQVNVAVPAMSLAVNAPSPAIIAPPMAVSNIVPPTNLAAPATATLPPSVVTSAVTAPAAPSVALAPNTTASSNTFFSIKPAERKPGGSDKNVIPPVAEGQASIPTASQFQPNSPQFTSPATQAQNVALDGYCPVYLRENKKWKKGDLKYGAIHRGRTYLFASEEAQKKFLANPDLYSPVMSGNDPVQLFSKGQYIPGKREYGVTVGERLYLFSDAASREEFVANRQKYTANVQLAENSQGGKIVR